MSNVGGCFHPVRQDLERLKQLLANERIPPSEEVMEHFAVLESGIDRLERRFEGLVRAEEDLESRLLQVENSRFFRLLRLPGRLLLNWKGRLGQFILRSPLRPFHLRLVPPRTAAKRYQLWVELEQRPARLAHARQPLLSIVIPVRNPRREWLEAAVNSVLEQTYTHWELCVCGDASASLWAAEYLAGKAASDPRIRFVRSEESLGISGTLNRAGQLARGEYVGFLNQDDTLAPFTLDCVAEAVQDGRPDLLYSDEDCMDEAGCRVQPIFKPAFSPDLLRCCMYIGHFLVVRKEKLDQVGWFRPAFDGSQDYDLALRSTETGGNKSRVVHIPRVLYHQRRHAASAFTHNRGLTALSEAMRRTGTKAGVESGEAANTYRVRWPIPPDLKASLVICSRHAKWLRRALHALEHKTTFKNREIIVVEHRRGDTAGMDKILAGAPCIRIPYTGSFDFAAMNNLGAARATGDVLVFLNDDVEPLTPDWLTELLRHAARDEVGVAGAMLLYPSGAIQHAGITIGIMNGAGHIHRNTFGAEYWNWLHFTRNVSAVTGACLAIRKSLFDRLGGFDQSFPVNFNDLDLCLRARKAGFEVVIEPSAVLRHYECQSRKPWIRLSERQLWEERWGDDLKRGDPFYSPNLTKTSENAGLELDTPPDLSPRF